ncbi:MAG: LysR family transcriptional regulator [Candidatus Protistobacter heckmanni]|nr:LysR family transcriptional regulator [Candidatus Protistobacter heckmanni]
MISIRRLEHFAALLEEKTFSRAARRLNLTQPALTRSIQTLEETLGLKLLDRGADGVSATDAGRMVLLKAQRLLAEARALRHEAELIRGQDSGHVMLGVGVFPAATFLSAVLVRQAREHPGLSVEVEIESWQRLLEKLKKDELDFAVALISSLPPPGDFEVRALPPQRAGLFARAGHPLAGRSPRQVRAALGRYRLAATKLPELARRNVAALYGLDDADSLPLALQCDSVDLLGDVALQTDTVIFATYEAIRGALDAGRLVSLAVDFAASGPLKLAVVHRKGRTLSPAAEWLIAVMREEAAARASSP